jgi:short-subunit dehydrogenase
MRMQDWLARNLSAEDEVVITGSSSGIGYEYAKSFSAAGCRLVCISNETEALAKQKHDFEKAYGNKIDTIDLDLRDVAATKDVAARLATRPVRVLINNAGFGLKGRFETHAIEEYVDIVAVNVTAPMVMTRALLPKMQQRGAGVIIHVASINALVPIPNNQVYTATKAFSASYASAVARENKNTSLRFQLVLPGTTRTPFHDRQGANPKNLVMMPEDVVKASLDDIERELVIPNRADRVLAKVIPFLPRNFAMDVASYLLKKRLGI